MSYSKQNFSDGDVLHASHLNHIEDGVVANEAAISTEATARQNAIDNAVAGKTVRYDAEQVLSDEAKARARENIGAASQIGHIELKARKASTASVTETFTRIGNPLTVTDALEEAAGLSVAIEPKQDLHGYGKPWVAGAGKNKAPTVAETNGWASNVGGSYTIQDDMLVVSTTDAASSGVYTSTNSALRKAVGMLSGVFTYSCDIKTDKASKVNIGISGIKQMLFDSTTEWTRISDTCTLDNAGHAFVVYNASSETTTAPTIYVKNLMIESGSVATAYEPYENICPISGYDNVYIGQYGSKNLVAGYLQEGSTGTNGVVNGSGQFSVYYARVRKGQQYTLVSKEGQAVYGYLDSASVAIGSQFCSEYPNRFVESMTTTVDLIRYRTITALIDGWIAWRTTYGDTTGAIYEGSRLLDYEAPKTDIIPISLMQGGNSETVYGGTLTVNEDGSGALVVDRALVTLTRQTPIATISQTSVGIRYAAVVVTQSIGSNDATVCNRYSKSDDGTHDLTVRLVSSSIYFYDNRMTDMATAHELLDGVQVVYRIAPQTFTFTAEQLTTLLSYNRISCDAGQMTLTYHRDKYLPAAKVLAQLPKATASGDVASFTDGADGLPMKKLTVKIEPKQDLHGYDKPWAEGSGKNLLPKGANSTANGVTYTVQEDGRVKVTTNGAATASTFWGVQFTIPAGTYVMTGCPSGGSYSTYAMDIRNTIGGAAVSDISSDVGKGSTFTITEQLTAYVNIRISSGYSAPSDGIMLSPMIRRAAETDPTFEPYSNICPISGWDEVEVERTGKNLFDPKAFADNGAVLQSDGSYYVANQNTLYNKEAWKNPGHDGQITITWIHKDAANATSTGLFVQIYYTDGTTQSLSVTVSPNAWRTDTATTAANKTVDKLVFTYASNTPGYYKVQLELGSTATTYEPYQQSTLPISLKSITGSTVYGGTATVNADGTGELVVDHRYWTADGSISWTKGANDNSWSATAGYNNDATTTGTGWCNYFNYVASWSSTGTMFAASNRIFIASGNPWNTLEEVQAAFAANPLQVVYPLAVPLVYTFTTEQMTTLLGTNNVSADCGAVTVTYARDLATVIQNLENAILSLGANA